jgi:NADPH-dependent 7-cyano-7-deazaguanine reductase QueF-like protein
MNQISEMDDELCPEYDFTQLTVIDRGQNRRKMSLTEPSNPRDTSDSWTEQDRSDIADFSLHYADSLFKEIN